MAKTLVLTIDDDLYSRFTVYDEGNEKNVKFMAVTAMRDYISKREARTRRAERQRAGKER
jgi:hypothetical protein